LREDKLVKEILSLISVEDLDEEERVSYSLYN
jgi:hypothetical protein